jgi:cytochrome b6-f complex iron-sulfur subunit
MDRRRLLQLLLALFGSTALVSVAYPLARFLAPPGGGAQAQKMSLKKSDLAPGEAKEIILNNTPVIVINRPDKGYVAFSRVCTHLGCLVEYDRAKNRLLCPCHAGVFDFEGKVISGPPPKPLTKFVVRVEGESIVIG